MLARVASNLFWLNRYLQRVDNTARLIRVHTNLLLDLPSADPAVSWLPLVSITGGNEVFTELGTASDEASICGFLIAEPENPGSVANILQAINANLRSSRDCMSTELYELIKSLCSNPQALTDQYQNPNKRQDLLKSIEHQSRAIAGAMSGTISRDTAYLFLRAGRLLERADMTSRILDVSSVNLLPTDAKSGLLPFENSQWVSVLRTLSAFQMYMKHVKKPVIGSEVLSFLLQNPQSPHAIHYCLTELARCIELIGPGQQAVEQQATEQQAVKQQKAKQQSAGKTHSNNETTSDMPTLNKLINTNQHADIVSLAKDKQQLHEYIDQVQIALIHINDDIASRYFPPNDIKGSQ